MNRLLKKIAATMWPLLLVATISTVLGAQETSNQAPPGAAPAATGPDAETQNIENPPLSGLDQPSFEPSFGARSYLVPRLQINEAVDTNNTGQLTTAKSQTVNQSPIRSVTRGLGSLSLQKLWKTHPLNLDYAGGLSWHQGLDKFYQVHSFAATQRFLWRTGQLALRDSFSYLPTGSFGFNSYGGSGVLPGGTGGSVPGGFQGNPLGNNTFGSTVNQPRVSNLSSIDITQGFSPRSSITVAGGYGFSDFLDNPTGYVNSHQTFAEVGYNRQLTRYDQLAAQYIRQDVTFPTEARGFFYSNAFHVIYGHRINGKLDFQLGGGPQWIHRFFVDVSVTQSGNLVIIVATPFSNTILSGSGRATLRYVYSQRTNLNLTYTHFANPGSGLLAGANTDAMRLALSHQLARRWSSILDTGYSYNKRILGSSTQQAGNAASYRFWYAGGTLRRQISRHVGAFANYQYDAIGFARGICTTNPGTPCATSYGRHVGLIGLDWTPGPIRLD